MEIKRGTPAFSCDPRDPVRMACMWEQVFDWVLRGIYVPYSVGKP